MNNTIHRLIKYSEDLNINDINPLTIKAFVKGEEVVF